MGLRWLAVAVLVVVCSESTMVWADELSKWTARPSDWKGATVADGKVVMSAEKWSYLVAPGDLPQVEVSANVTIQEAAKQLRFFGEGWSAWPDPTFGDGGFEAGVLVRGGEIVSTIEGREYRQESGFRVQLSHKYQCVALVKFPDGGYLRVVPCEVKPNQPIALSVVTLGNALVVKVDGKEKVFFGDIEQPLAGGRVGIGTSGLARVTFDSVAVTSLAKREPLVVTAMHSPKFSVRRWLGDRQWVFDGDEPILQLHNERDPSCFAKLKPGYKPQLTFDSHWGLENQGAFPDAASKWTEPVVSGGGDAPVKATWSARNVKDRFVTKSTLTIGFDAQRGTYNYDIDSELEVLPGEPFHFRYGFDFEHHTPLDPFRWQYLIAKRKSGELYHRPVYPIDPGPQNDLEMYGGQRVWFGRHGESVPVVPGVEYRIKHDWHRDPKDATKLLTRKLNTAVCAAFYDTGVSFEPETAAPGTKLRVEYRYTGVPAVEVESLFKQSKIYDSPTLDPQHHYIFADEWPKLTFRQFVPLSETWIYGRTPFMTAHNTRPTYELEKNCGMGSGFAMKLGPASFGKAHLPVRRLGFQPDHPQAAGLDKGRYVVTALVKSINAHGPGGRIELEAAQAKTNKLLAAAKHFVGNGTFDWKKTGFVFDVPEDAGSLSIAFGNSGTGEMVVTDVEFRRLADGEAPPADVASKPNDQPPSFGSAPVGAIADYRMLEGKGLFVFNHATVWLDAPRRDADAERRTTLPLGHLDLANLDWVVDSGRPAIRFADNLTNRKEYRRDSGLGRFYFGHPAYADKDTLPIALTGHHGGGAPMKGVTLAAWIKPAAEMGKGGHGARGDIIGFGARRFILGLHGQKAPYQLAARINVNDIVESPTKIEADRWTHVAMTAEPSAGQWHIRLYLDGKPVGEGTTKKFPADSGIVPSLILGAEIFYFHDAYYRGLIGHTLVFERTLSPAEVVELSKE